MRSSTDSTTLALGFVVGFFTGCCGIVMSALAFPRYLPGAVLGLGVRIGLAMLFALGEVSASADIDVSQWGRHVPWELVGAFVIGTVAVTAFVAGIFWVLDGFDDDDDDDDDDEDSQGRPQRHSGSYVTYTR